MSKIGSKTFNQAREQRLHPCPCLLAYVLKARIIFTGHSLGGALAQISSFYCTKYLESEGLDHRIRCITLGAPRIVNETAAKNYDRQQNLQCVRFVNNVRCFDNSQCLTLQRQERRGASRSIQGLTPPMGRGVRSCWTAYTPQRQKVHASFLTRSTGMGLGIGFALA